jgi:hypothetical protein
MTNESSASRPHTARLEKPHPTGGYDEVIAFPDGTLAYLMGGELHREDGPARVAPNGDMTWLRSGREHREDGPAVIFHDGERQHWLNGMRVSETTWRKNMGRN